MRLISAQELKEKLDRGDAVKLVNALGEWEYRAQHIPGSLHFSTPEETLRATDQGPEETRRHRHAGHDNHPIVRPLEPGEARSWCLVDQVGFALVLGGPYPGPGDTAGRVTPQDA